MKFDYMELAGTKSWESLNPVNPGSDMSWQAVRAATANPIKALKYE